MSFENPMRRRCLPDRRQRQRRYLHIDSRSELQSKPVAKACRLLYVSVKTDRLLRASLSIFVGESCKVMTKFVNKNVRRFCAVGRHSAIHSTHAAIPSLV